MVWNRFKTIIQYKCDLYFLISWMQWITCSCWIRKQLLTIEWLNSFWLLAQREFFFIFLRSVKLGEILVFENRLKTKVSINGSYMFN